MSSAAVVTGALRVKRAQNGNKQNLAKPGKYDDDNYCFRNKYFARDESFN